MSFKLSMREGFARMFSKPIFQVVDPVVKIGHIQKGNNVIFGRELKDGDTSNLLYLGKVIESSTSTSILDADVWLDTTFPHVIYITGTRGSGKSFDLGVILEGISSLNSASTIQNDVKTHTSIMVDTQSQFWTLGYEPQGHIKENQIQLEELEKWNIPPNSLNKLKLYAPQSQSNSVEGVMSLTIKPRDVTVDDWCSLFDQDLYGPQGYILSEIINGLSGRNYSIDDMISFASDDANFLTVSTNSRDAVIYKLRNYDNSGLFSTEGIEIHDLLSPNYCHLLMLRELSNADKSLITAIVARKLFTIMGQHHTAKKMDLFHQRNEYQSDLPDKVWLLIDEAHVVAPKDETSPARDALTEYVKRGRDAGLSLVMATQQPAAVDDKILSQVNLAINHRLTFQTDISAATSRLPTKSIKEMKVGGQSLKDFSDMIRLLDAGECFVSDHHTSRSIGVKIRPRVTAHGGYSPI